MKAFVRYVEENRCKAVTVKGETEKEIVTKIVHLLKEKGLKVKESDAMYRLVNK